MKQLSQAILAATLLWPLQSFAACSITLERLEIPARVKAGVGYGVSMPYRQQGEPELVRAHFWWDREGPFEYDVSQSSGTIRAQLFTRNPRDYRLSGRVLYRCGNRVKQANRVRASLSVKP